MSFSTGRGGAGNIVHASPSPQLNPQLSRTSNIDSTINGGHSLEASLSRDNDGEVYYSTGRGGAGNMNKGSNIPSPKLVPQGSNTPNLLQPVFSTGRGGFGNMVKNQDPELTRRAQDVDGLSPVGSNGSVTIGRGGYGNIISNDEKKPSILKKLKGIFK